MSQPTRREFVQQAGAMSGVVATMPVVPAETSGNSPDKIVVGFIGCGGRGNSLARDIADHAVIAYACDPDAQRCAKFQEATAAKKKVDDFRRILDDPSVDAVFIATPDHWHAPAAIMACQAGKHVYVEKPCSHNLREGRLLVEAARRNSVVVQHGTQSRSNPLIANSVQLLREGAIGDVLVAKAWNVQKRRDIGRAQPSKPPGHVNYDLWVGPAAWMPFQSNRFHYDWHWWYNFGTGDIGNDGTHEIDYARWGLGVDGLPSTVSSIGGKYFFNDDQQFPDTATCVFEWPGDGAIGNRRQLIFEMRLWSGNYPFNCDSGTEFYGTRGRMFVSKRGKLELFDDQNKRVESVQPQRPPDVAVDHRADFFAAIRRGSKPAADIAVGHDSTALVHLANAALRVNRSLHVDPKTETLVGDDEANKFLTGKYREGGHWAIPVS